MEYFELRNKLFFPCEAETDQRLSNGDARLRKMRTVSERSHSKNWTVYGHWGAARRESMAIVFAEFQDTIQELRPLTKGYEITCDTNEQFHIPHALYVCVFRDLVGTNLQMKVMLQNWLNVTGSNSYSGCHKCRMGFTWIPNRTVRSSRNT